MTASATAQRATLLAMEGALAITVGALIGLAGCGGGATGTQPAATQGALRPRPPSGKVITSKPPQAVLRDATTLNLTSALPRTVKRASATAAAKSRAVVYCPPLVPTGPARVDGLDGITTSRDFQSGFVANFESRSIRRSRSAPGHWTIAEGDPQALRVLLHPADYDPGEGSTAQQPLRLGRTRATLWLMPSFRIFHGIYGGHAVVVWRCAGREYHVSMHSHSNTQRTILIATALADELPLTCRRRRTARARVLIVHDMSSTLRRNLTSQPALGCWRE